LDSCVDFFAARRCIAEYRMLQEFRYIFVAGITALFLVKQCSLLFCFLYFASGRGSMYCDKLDCVSVCPYTRLFAYMSQ